MGRRLGLVDGNLDARGRVPDVDRLRRVSTCVSTSENVCLPWRWQDQSTCASGGYGGYPVERQVGWVGQRQGEFTYGFAGEDGSLGDLLHEEGVVVLSGQAVSVRLEGGG